MRPRTSPGRRIGTVIGERMGKITNIARPTVPKTSVHLLTCIFLAVGSNAALAQEPESSGPFDKVEWEHVLDAARKEGEVTIYTSNTPDVTAVLRSGFTKKYPDIQLFLTKAPQPSLEAKIEAERQTNAPGADLVTFAWDTWFEINVQQQAFIGPIGPSASSGDWTGNKYLTANYVTTNFVILGLGWNTSLVGRPLKSYADFLRPELGNGKIGIIDLSSPVQTDFYTFLEDNYGPEYLPKLASQRPRIYPAAPQLMQAVAAGEVSAGNWVTGAILDEKNMGAPVAFAVPNPAFSAPTNTAILMWAKHPNAAQVLMDYMMSRDGQEALAKGGASPLKGIHSAVADPDQLRPVNPQRLTPEYMKQYSAKWNSLFR